MKWLGLSLIASGGTAALALGGGDVKLGLVFAALTLAILAAIITADTIARRAARAGTIVVDLWPSPRGRA